MESDELDKSFQKYIDRKTREGWTVIDKSESKVTLRKRGFGSLKAHILLLILTAWWTFFLGNIMYAVYKYVRGTTNVITENDIPHWIEGETQATSVAEDPDEDEISEFDTADQDSMFSRYLPRIDSEEKAFLLGGWFGRLVYQVNNSNENESSLMGAIKSGIMENIESQEVSIGPNEEELPDIEGEFSILRNIGPLVILWLVGFVGLWFMFGVAQRERGPVFLFLVGAGTLFFRLFCVGLDRPQNKSLPSHTHHYYEIDFWLLWRPYTNVYSNGIHVGLKSWLRNIR